MIIFHVCMCYIIIYIWVILLKTGQNCDTEGKNSKCEFFNAIIWKRNLDISCAHKYKKEIDRVTGTWLIVHYVTS